MDRPWQYADRNPDFDVRLHVEEARARDRRIGDMDLDLRRQCDLDAVDAGVHHEMDAAPRNVDNAVCHGVRTEHRTGDDVRAMRNDVVVPRALQDLIEYVDREFTDDFESAEIGHRGAPLLRRRAALQSRANADLRKRRVPTRQALD